tara:strand:+ start:1178 stop:1927 length:750 start_codon:yes stop_codon:yes gene_type:complete
MKVKYLDLINKKIFISGGAEGIGSSIVEHFCEQGAKVIFVDINVKKAKELIKNIQKKKFNLPKFFKCNILDIKKLQYIIQKNGPFDVLINNAGNDQRHSIHQVTERYFKNRIDTNLKHYFFAVKAAKKGMIKNNGGSIINLSSICWIRGAPRFILYSSAKSAIFGLSRSLARELGKYNIRVNAISPGSIATERQLKLWLKPKLKKEIMSLQCLKRQILPEDIANMTLYLASDVSSGCTKQNFIVDAGIT